MDICKNEFFESSLMNNESKNGENILYIDSSDDVSNINSDIGGTKTLLNIHTPSPMVTRSCFSESNCESWKNVSAYSFSQNIVTTNGKTETPSAFNNTNKYVAYNVIGDNKSLLSHNWINCQQVKNCSPELVRRNDIIFEENTPNDNSGDLDNSDYSDRSQSPVNSVSSDDPTNSSGSDNSENSSQEESTAQDNLEIPPGKSSQQMKEQESNFIDFQYIFINNGDDEFFGKRYHQLPKAIDRDAAKRLARRLYDCDGFKITDVAKHLSKRNDFSQIVGEEFANFFDLMEMRLDVALRLFLSKFTLTGDTQERERIMHHFSKRYVTCNTDMYNGEDACHTLVCALIILNTNLHSQAYPKMSLSDFINNLKELNDGDNFPTENLEELFLAIEREPIRWPLDDELVGIVNMNKSEMIDMSKHLINTSYTLGLEEPRDSNCRDFMCGYVVKKWLKEPGGRKTAFGKRGWKLYYGRLRDLTIYLYKDHDKSYSQPKPVTKRQNSVAKATKSKLGSKQDKKSANNSEIKVKNVNETGSEIVGNRETVENNNKATVLVNGKKNKSSILTNNTTSSADCSSAQSTNTKDLSPNTESPSDPSAVIRPTVGPVDVLPSNSQPILVLPPADSEIHIHHAFASRCIDYIKKKNVFRIKTKYGSEYLFQVNNEKEMESWIDNINYVAALLSDPEPIIGISTMEKLSSRSIPRPKITNLNVRNQLESHQKCVLELEKIISNLKENPPKKSDKKIRQEFEESIKFREEELLRYKTYSQLLEFEIRKMQNLTNMRCISGGDVPFFCQSFPMAAATTANPSILVPNHHQGIILNQQLLNGMSGPDGYVTNPLLFNAHHQQQPPPSNLRFRPPPVLHNLTAVSNNRRLRYRMPAAISMSVVPAVNHHLGTGEQVPTVSVDTVESPREAVVFSPASSSSTSTFYEIV